MIAHKDPLARSYLRLILKRDLELADCAEADNLDALLARLRQGGSTKLAVVDLELPGLSCEVGLRYLTSHYPTTRVAVLFGKLTRDLLQRLSVTGVAALIPKGASAATLADMLRRVMDAQGFVSFAAVDGGVEEQVVQSSLLHQELTARQREVLRLLSRGYSNREIGHMLGVAEGTVKVHVNAAFKALGVHNRVSAAVALRSLFESGPTEGPDL
ncbi:response regulator transcription factor [Sphingomonas sp. BN140010]|uniref:Response regulator transcription factor n=1 Tax=Sphingomonas arvum TaxID=2992113 RepID=A0ABT3JDA5_9SPHN|nr:response regulator transcription factor [Sphingomonas sp. BN140010]MCW3796994.1 response regulator transcription factor [Sphingomonas sp. BN140010]